MNLMILAAVLSASLAAPQDSKAPVPAPAEPVAVAVAAPRAADAPVLTRPSATRVVVSGATYMRISPPAQVLDGTGEPIMMADVVMAMDGQTPVVFVVDPAVSYEVLTAVHYEVPDPDNGGMTYATDYFTLESVPDRIDRVQALILQTIALEDLRSALGPIAFSEVVEALNRLRDSGDLPGAGVPAGLVGGGQ